MYIYLRAEMKRRKFTGEELAQAIGISYRTFHRKMKGGTFTMPEIMAMREILESYKTIDELGKFFKEA